MHDRIENVFLRKMDYDSITRPPGSPPSWLFGPVWSVIYAAYGALGILLFARRGRVDAAVWYMYAVGWAVNLLWIPIFQNRFTTYFNGLYIGALLLVVLNLAGFLWGAGDPWVRRGALLLIPYVVWLCVASSLGFALHQLN